jgi:hypothetical protein
MYFCVCQEYLVYFTTKKPSSLNIYIFIAAVIHYKKMNTGKIFSFKRIKSLSDVLNNWWNALLKNVNENFHKKEKK